MNLSTQDRDVEVVRGITRFCERRDMGGIVEIDEELFDYFLDVLPPVWMHRAVEMPDGRTQRTTFGFAEGLETVTAFWTEGKVGTRRYFAQRTNIRNPTA